MNYLIECKIISPDGWTLFDGKVKIKNKENDLYAKTYLEDVMRRRYRNFGRLIITSCEKDTFASIFDMFGITK